MKKDFNDWWEEINYFQEEMQKFVKHISEGKAGFTEFGEEIWIPSCDIFETSHHVVIVVELAGVSPQEVEVLIEGKKLIVKGQRKELPYSSKENYHLMEIRFGPFYREISLPEEIGEVKAKYSNGFLVIEGLKNVRKRKISLTQEI
ncbi:MAG TPA: Hsp20/alpha crystallin family protein [Candidatus Atribacteria bacterium]|nr:Hsp20/alpha crystallin family protein [Candidatus Atribacteria bacterium]